MDEIKLHDGVLIVKTGVIGVVVGVWIDEDEFKKFSVRYLDDQSVIREQWFGAYGLKRQ